ncbi:DUF4041 domain-containing protein [Sporocytophaga myxococcoides]|uniref:DUF4041 domain-containing protein n=1 Tax=Sporocytophaga myxococcoides TaxID=153721 RepID=UPI00041CBD95|nr:DUF4041 domain-containing protein [Sporocytophaga myxococcoides]
MGLFDFLKKKEFEEIRFLKQQLEKYKPIIDVEKEAETIKQKLQSEISAKNNEILTVETEYENLKANYRTALSIYTNLRKEIGVYENKLDLVEFGIYEPVYDFEKSDDYRAEQNNIIEKQKQLIANETAAVCRTSWSVEGSEAKGRAITKKVLKLMLRAFNGECDALIAKVKWNNVNQMKERINKSFEAINKLGDNYTASIQRPYLELKIQELILEHEYQLKRQKEKETLRLAQEELRDEERARREFEQAQKQAEKDEANYQKALEKARKEVAELTGEKQQKLLMKIELLENELKEAHERKERALSMAQQTKRGHVYIISNIGSFGENVFKIGMTRRLEPTDRVKELGDASVPFQFDIHSMIFSDEAPTLENELHKAFSDRKVNMINSKREFFNVSIEEIEAKIKELGIDAEFIRLPEAMEYRETMAILNRMKNQEPQESLDELVAKEFPTAI